MGNDVLSLSNLYIICTYILHPGMTVVCTISRGDMDVSKARQGHRGRHRRGQ